LASERERGGGNIAFLLSSPSGNGKKKKTAGLMEKKRGKYPLFLQRKRKKRR